MVTNNNSRVLKVVTPSALHKSKNGNGRRASLHKGLKACVLGLCLLFGTGSLRAQDFAVKSNLLYDLNTTVSAGAEYRIAPQWTVDLSGSLNAWTFSDDRKWKKWVLQPEARYWFCDAWAGHFVGVHAQGGQFNTGGVNSGIKMPGTDFSGLKDHRYQGWMAGLGLAYGYDWVLGRHWNLEAEIGLGWNHCWYDEFRCTGCGKKIATGEHDWFGPTKLALSIVYLF